MLNEQTVGRLQALRLTTLATAWAEQQRQTDMNGLSFDERLGLLVEAEWLARENKRIDQRRKDAKLKVSQACIENIDYPARRELDRAVVRQLATGRWIEEHQGLIITGPTGVGKTYVGCAFAERACRMGYRVLYRRSTRLFDEFALARADGSWSKLLAKFARVDVLFIDDLAIAPLADRERRDLLEIMEDRFDTRSTIITSQLPTDRWHDYIGDPTVADALCERLLHKSHRLELKGPTRRKGKVTDD